MWKAVTGVPGLLVVCLLGASACSREREPMPREEIASTFEREKEPSPALGRAEPATERFLRASPAQVAPFVRVGEDSLAPLQVARGEPIKLNLALAGRASWDDVFVSDVAVRTLGKIATLKVKNGALEHTFEEPGPTLVTGCTGPKSLSQLSNAWELVTHCSKVLVRARDGSGPDPGITRKTGAPLEVLPVMSPLRLSVGDELPVRFYAFGGKWKEQPVEVFRPDGTKETLKTNSQGLTHVRLNQAGRWVIRLVAKQPEGERTGEFVFDMPERRTP